MDSGNVGGSDGDGGNLRTLPATTTLGEGNHSVPGKQLNNSPSSASESSSEGSVQLGATTAPFNTETISKPEPNNQTFPVVELGGDLRTSASTVLPKDDLFAITSSTGPSFEDPFQWHANGTSTQAPNVTADSPKHGSKPSSDMWTYPTMNVDEGDVSNRGMALGQPPPTSSTNPFQMSELADSNSNEGPLADSNSNEGPQKIDTRFASDNSDEEFPVSSMPKNEQLGQGLAESPSSTPAVLGHHNELSTSGSSPATQSPPVQVMEHPSDPSTSTYRLPSYVFARTNTTAPMEWSTASNESLFSIHGGNMSFTGDQFYNFGKSGELGPPGDLTMSGPLVDFSSNQPPPPLSNTQTDTGQKSANLDEVSRLTEAKAAETMREVIREIAENQKKEDELLAKGASAAAVQSPSPAHSPPSPSPQSSISHNSDASTKSFAFQSLAGEEEKSISRKAEARKQTQQAQQQQQPQSKSETPKESSYGAAPAPKEAGNETMTTQFKWLSCFSCCPFCSCS